MFTIKIVEADRYSAFSVDSYTIKRTDENFTQLGLIPSLYKHYEDEHATQWITVDHSGHWKTIYVENAMGKTIDKIHIKGTSID